MMRRLLVTGLILGILMVPGVIATPTILYVNYSTPMSYGGVSQFNVTWDSDFNVSIFETNITGILANYTAIRFNNTNTSSFNATFGAGSYQWRMIANDSTNSFSSTAVYYFNTSKSSLHFTLNSIEGDLTITYPDTINATWWPDAPQSLNVTLERNGTNIDSEDNVAIVIGAGTWNYTMNTTGNQNYSAESIFRILTVSKGIPTLHLDFNDDDANETVVILTYPASLNVTGWTDYQQNLTLYLYNNGNLSNIQNDTLENSTILGVGVYNYSLNTSGNSNYSSNEISYNLTVVKGDPLLQLFLNGVQGYVGYNEDDNANFTVSVVPGLPVNLTSPDYVGFVEQSGTTRVEYSIGLTNPGTNYNLTAWTAGNQNYSSSRVTHYFDVLTPLTSSSSTSGSSSTGSGGGLVTSNSSGSDELTIIDWPRSLTVTENGTLYSSVTVQNTGTKTAQNIVITIEGIGKWWVSNPDTTSLAPGQGQVFSLKITPLKDAKIKNYSISFVVSTSSTTTRVSSSLAVYPSASTQKQIVVNLTALTRGITTLRSDVDSLANQGQNVADLSQTLVEAREAIDEASIYIGDNDWFNAALKLQEAQEKYDYVESKVSDLKSVGFGISPLAVGGILVVMILVGGLIYMMREGALPPITSRFRIPERPPNTQVAIIHAREKIRRVIDSIKEKLRRSRYGSGTNGSAYHYDPDY